MKIAKTEVDSGGFDLAVRNNSRASVLEHIEAMLSFHISNGRKLPNLVPAGNKNASAWFLDFLIEPYDKTSDRVFDTHAGGYVSGYLQRVDDYMRRFLSLTEAEQRYVIASKEDGCYWRGDDVRAFPLVVDETVKYKSLSEMGKAAYRKNTIAMIRQRGGAKSV